jgi:hypothetical protein
MMASSTGFFTFFRTGVPAYSQILQLPRSIVTAAVYRGFISGLAPLHLTFRHRAGVSPYTSAYALAETCVFSKQSDGPILCGPRQLTARSRSPSRAPLLPKLRGNFAEFLSHVSLDRLGILFPPTCVGLRYGRLDRQYGLFLEAWNWPHRH